MALALALALAGFEEEDFRGLTSLSSQERAITASPPSTRSESSGISSLVSSSNGSSCGTLSSLSSAASSRSETPETGPPPPPPPPPNIPTKADALLRALHKKRDILNLAANLNDPSWNLKSPALPRNDAKSYAASRSIHHRLGPNALEEDYPTRVCRHCGFTEPSPYLF